jgi:hypothetical protein
MNVISRVIVSLVYYNSLVRDTLEYTLNKEAYDVSFYDYKQNGIINEIKLETPLKLFLDKNGDKGAELKKRLEKFGEDFYSDKSTVIKKASDGLRVDHAQNVKIFEAVIPLHEELNSIIVLHINHAKETNMLEDNVVALKATDERFYRGVALLALGGEIFRQFDEYNKARKEANGEITPQSNFIQQDLNKLVGLFGTVRQYATCNDEIYTNALDALWDAVEMMNGKRQVPAGKNFQDVINDVNIKVGAFVSDAEAKWKDIYPKMIQELTADNAKAREEAKATAEKPAENK